MSNTSFAFRHMLLLSACSIQIHATSRLSFMSHHRINNKCNRVRGQHWRWLIHVIRNLLLHNSMLRVFRSNHDCSWKFHEFHCKTHLLESLFYLKIMKLYKDILFCMNKPYFCRYLFLIDWRHKYLKNTIDLLLLCGEHFYEP